MKVGIVGGVSPVACSNFYNSFCEKYRQETHLYPDLLIYSIEVSESQEKEFLSNKVSEETLQKLASELNNACLVFKNNNIDIVVICCNTLSNIFSAIACQYNFKFILTPVDSVNNYITKHQGDGLLISTAYTAQQQLYKNLNLLDEEDQQLIYSFLNDKINMYDSPIKIDDILQKYHFDYVVLGCTDLTKEDISLDAIIIDSNDCLLDDLLLVVRDV